MCKFHCRISLGQDKVFFVVVVFAFVLNCVCSEGSVACTAIDTSAGQHLYNTLDDLVTIFTLDCIVVYVQHPTEMLKTK